VRGKRTVHVKKLAQVMEKRKRGEKKGEHCPAQEAIQQGRGKTAGNCISPKLQGGKKHTTSKKKRPESRPPRFDVELKNVEKKRMGRGRNPGILPVKGSPGGGGNRGGGKK